ncbi:nicotinate phosphoribosyltransferase [Entomomonas moraniae]|uniref:Nicotinate phosphoribosyltransferase n=1 Tax=Entomomonas moraniae TaxID=2213226 RepID=A0A3S9XBP3_9GAMM|nr:nicotinate phosphoribosyltransferase [Entomomonas moraniae]AZS49837.1 nicotinate phosphoribosyltransferase [Entomomonas moraniae]
MESTIFSQHIIRGILDTDFYKLSMMQAILHNYPNAEVEWEFRCRDQEDFTAYIPEIKRQIEELADLQLTEDEQNYLSHIKFLTPDYIRFLRLFRFNPRYVTVSVENGQLSIILKGPWLHIVLFEIALLAIISEVRNKARYPSVELKQVNDRLYDKLDNLTKMASDDELKEFKLADYGTRRRFSYEAQHSVVEILTKEFPGNFVGTSNVHLAQKFNIRPLGTMAHEWIMAHQQLGFRLKDCQIAALDCWVREYRGLLGIALTDCITMDAFLKDFDLYFAKLFDGLRHDSGDPIIWAEKAIAHYKSLGIDPRTKTLVFSDGLNFPKALSIFRQLRDRINVSFGIGTNLTCDIEGVSATNMVIKMVSCNGQPVAKISDSPGKTQCRDASFVSYLKHVFNVESE